jgi:hypothetical protein
MNKNKKVVAAVSLSVILLAATITAIVVFGHMADPEYSQLRNSPDASIDGTVAYVTNADGKDCVWVVKAAGGQEPKQLGCLDFFMADLRFTNDGKLLAVGNDYSYKGFRLTVVVYDPESGAQIETFALSEAEGRPTVESGVQELFTSDDGFDGGFFGGGSDGAHTVWVARDPEGDDRIISRKAPGNYYFSSAMYSPDRKWLLIRDSDGRLLIGDEQNDVRELTSIDDEEEYYAGFGSPQGLAWFQPGQSAQVVDLAEVKRLGRLPGDSSTGQPVPDAFMTTDTFEFG